MFYFDPTYLWVLPGLLLGLWAQARVKSAYHKYSKVPTQRGQSAADAIRYLLNREGAEDVVIAETHGTLTDHYDPRSNTLRLSQGVHDSASVAALGIAAHEAGHALQKQENYPFLALRSMMVPMVNIGSHLAWPIFFLGIIASWDPLMYAGIILFALAVLFSLITLPVEFNASKRAMQMLTSSGYLTRTEEEGARKVLNAAAMTYVASFIAAALQLLRLVALANRRRD